MLCCHFCSMKWLRLLLLLLKTLPSSLKVIICCLSKCLAQTHNTITLDPSTCTLLTIRPMLSVRLEVGVSLLLAPAGVDKRSCKAPFPLAKIAGVPAILQREPGLTESTVRPLHIISKDINIIELPVNFSSQLCYLNSVVWKNSFF